MKLKWTYLKLIMALAIISSLAPAQIVNGDFSSNTAGCGGGLGCCGINPFGWTGSNDLQVTTCCNTGNTNGWWLDITTCGQGNGHWIEQTIPTVPGRIYFLEWDLGCWNGVPFFDAGVDVSIGGNALGRFAFTDFTGNSLAWQHFKLCFIATQNSTAIRFTGDGAPTPSTTPGRTDPEVIGLDNVVLTDVTSLFWLSVSPGLKCNEFCLTLNSMAPPDVTVSNENWFVDNVLEQTNTTTFCRVFPKNVTKQVRVEFTITTTCGTMTFSLQQPITANNDCPCDLAGATLNYSFVPCNTHLFSLSLPPGYSLVHYQWTIDGAPVTAPASGASFSGLSAGQHTICIYATGSVDGGEPSDTCNVKRCQVIVAPPTTVYNCSVSAEACFQLTDEQSPWYFTRLMSGCPDCRQTVLNATQAGPWKILGHYPSGPGGGPRMIVTREYYDAVNCKKCIITFTVANTYASTAMVIGQPCTTVPLPACLQGQMLNIFINGHPEATSQVPGGTDITLCCNNPYGILNPTYIIYSETDPCCNMIITLDCSQASHRVMVPTGNEQTDPKPVSSELKILPNPTSSVFRIVSEKDYATFEKIEISDLNGKLLLTRKQIDSNTQIDATSLNKGSYVVRVTTNDGQQTTLKLIVISD